MRRYIGRSGVALLGALCAAVAVTSCGGTGGAPPPRTPQFVIDPVGTTSNSGSLVMGVSRDSIDANRADRIDITARVLDPARQPLVGLGVSFAASIPDANFIPGLPGTASLGLEGTAQAGLERSTQAGFPEGFALTDFTGLAEITLQAPGTPGRMAVTASTPRNMNLSGLIFINVLDVGFIPQPNDQLVIIPAEIDVVDPTAGTMLEFLIVGGIPFQPPAEPYIVQNGSSGVGVAELVFDGQYPALIAYTIGGMVEGAHVFSVVDGSGQSVTGTVMVEFTELTIVPEIADLAVGQSQVFALSGGVPPYTCVPSGGILTPTTILERGGTTTFTASEVPVESSFTIVCSDQSGQTVTAEVNISPLPSPSGGPVTSPTPPPEADTLVLQANPPSLNGVEGGISTITANVLDGQFEPLPGIPVLFTLGGQSGTPTPTVPSLSTFRGVSDGNGQVVTQLNVPAGTPPQFLTVSAEADNGTSASVQVGITSQRTEPAGPPARISAALLRQDACQLNQDGTLTAILSALVIDANGNPVDDGVAVDWGPVTPATAADVVSPSFTNGEPPCNVSQYRAECSDEGPVLTISPQPGTATTCFIFDANRAGDPASVTATVSGTSITTTTFFNLPAPPPGPTPVPTTPPAATPTPGPPNVVPASATLQVGQTQVFGVSGGLPPYTVNASGGNAVPTTIPSSGGTFNYTASQPGNFTIVVTDSNGQIDTASVTNQSGSVIQVDKPGPLNVPVSGSTTITITTGGVPPYTVTLTGGLGGSISGSPLPAPGSFTYNAPAAPTGGQILITDSAGTPNTRAISVSVP